jgi:hypothetical protein
MFDSVSDVQRAIRERFGLELTLQTIEHYDPTNGSSLNIIPSAIIEPTDDAELHKRNVRMSRPWTSPGSRSRAGEEPARCHAGRRP